MTRTPRRRLNPTHSRRGNISLSLLALGFFSAVLLAPQLAAPLAAQDAKSAKTQSADKELAGVLSILAQPEGPELIGLKDKEQIEKIRQFIQLRQQAGAKHLADSKADADAKRKQREDWIRESEQLGQQLLSLEQRQSLLQFILADQGMRTLARQDVALILKLDEQQKAQVEAILKEREALESATPLRRKLGRQNCERRLQAVLKPAQLAQWETLAGLQRLPILPASLLATPADKTDKGNQKSSTQPTTTVKGDAGNAKPTDESPQAALANKAANKAPGKETEERPQEPTVKQATLQFAFEGVPWRTVLDWLAEEAELSLYVGSLPTGSLTYSDQKTYTPDQAIERINRFLIPIGYTLIRSGKMISVIGLEDTRRDQLLDALAEYCDLKDLDKRGDHEVVKCMFTIAKADPAELLPEIVSISKLSRPVMMPKSKQLILIDTAAKLRMVRDVIQAIENPSADQGPIRRFTLKHVRVNDILPSLRPLIGIEDENSLIGQEVSISITPGGREMLATGSNERMVIIEAVIAMLDVKPETESAASKPILKAHPVKQGNLQTIDDVLQTLLAGETVRLAQEPQSNRLIALATPAVHERIAQTISELEGGKSAVFATITLKEMEPFFALSVVREMLDIPFFVDEDDDRDYPRIDSDTESMRIFVRGTQEQVDEIREIIDALENPEGATTEQGPYRTLPIHGQRAQQLLERAKRFWPNEGDLQVFPFEKRRPNEVLERVINDPARTRTPMPPARTAPSAPSRQPNAASDSTPAKPAGAGDANTSQAIPVGRGEQIFVAAQRPTKESGSNAQPQPGAEASNGDAKIKAQVTPQGIMLYSKDPELLDKFERHLRTIAGPGALSKTRMAIFYLTHISVNDAKRMLVDLRRGESRGIGLDDDEESGGGRSRYRYVPPPSVTADARLNRLIVQGTADQIVKIEDYLQIIDRDRSIADVQIRGKPQIIQLYHIRADEAANVIREAYAGQIQGAAPAAKAAPAKQAKAPQPANVQMGQIPNQPTQPQQPDQQRKPGANQNKGGGKEQGKGGNQREQGPKPPSPIGGSQGQETNTQEPRIGLAVDRVNNALIVRAPQQLFNEVAELIRLIDTNATQTTTVLGYEGVMNANQIREALRQALGSSGASRSSSAPKPAAPKPTPPKPAPPAISTPQILFRSN